jgi:hypothetical protein
MRAFSKAMVKVSLSIMALGFLFLLIGFFTGANDEMKWNQNLLSNRNLQKLDETYNNVKSLDVNLRYGDVRIVEGEQFRIKSKGIILKGFETDVKDGIWKISDEKVPLKPHMNVTLKPFNIGYTTQYAPEITIYVPKGFTSKNLNLSVDAGRLKIDSISSTGEADITVGAGKIDINQIQAENATITCGAGSILTKGIITGNSLVKCDVGKVVMDLKGKEEDYNYDINCNLGVVKINDQTYNFHSEKQITNDNAKNRLNLECNVGEIDLLTTK